MIKFIFGCIIIPILGSSLVAAYIDFRGVKTPAVFYILGYLMAVISVIVLAIN